MRSVALLGALLVFAFTLDLAHGQADRKAGPERIARLIEQLGDDDFDVREKASKELTRIGAEALPALRKAAVGAPDLEVRRRAAHAIRDIAGPNAVPREKVAAQRIARLIDQLGADSFDVREKATAELARIGVEAVPALRRAATHPDVEVQRRAAHVLWGIEARPK